jgi:serine/threonine-protein phosphatase Stp1
MYRWRAGALEQLTRDHNLAEIAGTGGSDSNVITKAVGVEPNLSLDIYRDSVLPDDRFLLCSDGLTRTVSQEDISLWMAHPDINEAVSGLIRTTLNAGAPDNVTVVIAQARRDTASSAGVSA